MTSNSVYTSSPRMHSSMDTLQLQLSNSHMTTQHPWLKKDLVESRLYESTDLTPSQISTISQFILDQLGKYVLEAKRTGKSIRLHHSQTKLSLSIEIKPDGIVQLPLKKHGDFLGAGEFRKTKTALLLSDEGIPLAAHQTQRILSQIQLDQSNRELITLYKIGEYLSDKPLAKGLLRIYDQFHYYQPNKIVAIIASGYDNEITAKSEQKVPETVFKRALTAKRYNLGNLQERMHELSLSNKILTALFMLSGLSSLHSLHIFHSDIKPGNIFLDWNDEEDCMTDAAIGDFGFACDLSVPDDRYFKNGDIMWRAPEIDSIHSTAERSIDERIFAADIYSMGLVLKQLFKDIQHEELTQLTDSMTAPDPGDRPTADETRLSFLSLAINLTNSSIDE